MATFDMFDNVRVIDVDGTDITSAPDYRLAGRLTGRQVTTVGRVFAKRYTRDQSLAMSRLTSRRAHYVIARELYPAHVPAIAGDVA